MRLIKKTGNIEEEQKKNNESFRINKTEGNNNGNQNIITPSTNVVNKNEINNSENEISDLFYCNKCDNYMKLEEKEDHMYSHQMENNFNESHS